MTSIVAIAGSLRRASFNLGLLHAARDLAPAGVTIEIHTPHGIPLYDGDAEAAGGIPEAVMRLKNAVAGADGVLLASPEYNNGIPGVFKNAIDWLSRPASDIPRVFGGRSFALMGASPGGFGTILAQDAWLTVLRTLGVRFWNEGRLLVSRAGQAFDAEGRLTDEATRERLRNFVTGFATFSNSAR